MPAQKYDPLAPKSRQKYTVRDREMLGAVVCSSPSNFVAVANSVTLKPLN
jgi:hypothetical protein